MKRKAVIKRYRPKRRLRISIGLKKHKNTILLLVSYALVVTFIFFFVKMNHSNLTKIKNISFTKTTIGRISVESPDVEIQKQVEEILSEYIDRPYSHSLTEEIERSIKQLYPYIRVESKFNPITGTLSVKARKIQAIARLEDKDLYVLEDLTLSDKNPQPGKGYPNLKATKINKYLVEFISRISKTELFTIIDSTITIDMETNNPTLKYGDELEIILPSNFEGSGVEIRRIKRVIDDARSKMEGKFRVDARYVSDGKIIVSAMY